MQIKPEITLLSRLIFERDRSRSFKDKYAQTALEYLQSGNMQSAQKASSKAQREHGIEKRLDNIIKEHQQKIIGPELQQIMDAKTKPVL